MSVAFGAAIPLFCINRYGELGHCLDTVVRYNDVAFNESIPFRFLHSLLQTCRTSREGYSNKDVAHVKVFEVFLI